MSAIAERLREYLIKGFAMDDARLKRAGGGNYFEELLARIREILTHAVRISHDDAKEKAEAEFALFRRQQAALPQPVDQHFEQSLDELKRIETQAKESKKKAIGKETLKKNATKKPKGMKRSDD